MRGVFVEAEISHEHDAVAEVITQLAKGHLHDAIGIPGAGSPLVLGCGNSEEDESGDSERHKLGNLGA